MSSAESPQGEVLDMVEVGGRRRGGGSRNVKEVEGGEAE